MDGDLEMDEKPYRDDELTGRIIECVITVHKKLGPGFVESIYSKALAIELRKQGIPFEREKEVRIYYEGELVGTHRLDLLVAGSVVVETKTVESLSGAHYAQVRSYLRAPKLVRGLLVNFAGERAEFRRVEI